MRAISRERDILQIVILLMIGSIYVQYFGGARANGVSGVASAGLFLLGYCVTVFFMYVLAFLIGAPRGVEPYMFTFAYTYVPTFVWFGTSSLLYRLLPPPRLLSFPGIAFSIFFVGFSLSLLIWKMILFYLALRFSTGFHATKIAYIFLLYICAFTPFVIGSYIMGVFRVPFL